MKAQHNSVGVVNQPDSRPLVDTTLRGSRLLLARATWIIVTILTVGVFVASMPPFIVALFRDIPAGKRNLANLDLPTTFFDLYVIDLVAFSLVTMLAFLITAVIIFWRKSDDWMMMLTSFALVTFGAAVLPPTTALDMHSALHLPVTLVRALGYGSILLLLYLFPDGRFVPRWMRILAIIWVVWTVSWVFVPAVNPFTWSLGLGLPLLMASLGTGVLAQIYRYRRVSPPVQQQQTKVAIFGLTVPFVTWVIVFLPAAVVPDVFGSPDRFPSLYLLIGQPLVTLSLILMPLTIGMSVLRFRLWDVDLIINRTMVYGGLTGVLVLFYAGSVVFLQWLFRAVTGQTSDLAIVYTTLTIAFLFMPLRRRLQDFIDRRFYRRQYDAAQTLAAFSEKARDEVDLNQLTDDLLAVVEETMQPRHVSLWIHGEPDAPSQGTFGVRSVRGKPAAAEVEIASDDPIVAYSQNTSGVVKLDRLELDSPALPALEASNIKLLVPLISQGELVGLLNLGPRLSEQEYSADDGRLLSNLATQAAPAIRVAQLVRQQQAEVRARERLEQELRVARLIQQTLLPDEVPALPGWELATHYQPARAVGGDFYDFVELPDGRLGLIVGDVADKGMPAALMMASARSFLRAAARRSKSPSQVLAEVNNLLCPDMPRNMFVTCLYAILDPASGRLDYANAGQTLPYRRINGRVVELEATGMPLGVVPHTTYEEKIATLEPGESLLFYSDGLVEAHNPRRQMFSFPRLETLVANHPGDPPLIDFLLAELAQFTGAGWEQEDDVTMLTLHRSATGETRATTNDASIQLEKAAANSS